MTKEQEIINLLIDSLSDINFVDQRKYRRTINDIRSKFNQLSIEDSEWHPIEVLFLALLKQIKESLCGNGNRTVSKTVVEGSNPS